MFRHSHDPTQLNRQGNDVGTQYRSAIFPNSPEQEAAASAAIERNQTDWPQPIVTTVEPFDIWWRAEDYHQEYFDREGGRNPYCIAVAAPSSPSSARATTTGSRRPERAFCGRAPQAVGYGAAKPCIGERPEGSRGGGEWVRRWRTWGR